MNLWQEKKKTNKTRLEQDTRQNDLEQEGIGPISKNMNNTVITKPKFFRCDRCCGNFKPPRAHHNHITGRCIVKFDHYCPWSGNAIGALNHKHFCLFLFYTLIAAILSIMFIGMKLSWECRFRKNDDDQYIHRQLLKRTSLLTSCQKSHLSLSAFFLTIQSIYFGFFTFIMLIHQHTAIVHNRSMIAQHKIENKQGTVEELGRVTESINEMFGGTCNRMQWHWFVPLPVQFPNGMREVILGYIHDPSRFGTEPWHGEDVFEYVKLPAVL